MTVSTTTAKVTYTGNGATVAFPTTFPFYDTTDLQVIERVIATGVETVKTLTTHYTVSGGLGLTGTVTAVVAPSSLVKWTIKRATPLTQDIDYVENDPFPAATHEEGLDRGVMRDQELDEVIDRSLKFPATDSTALSTELPSSVTRATKVLAFDATGAAIASTKTLAEFESSADDAAASAAASAASAGASAASAAAAAATYDSFDDRYLGAKASDPTLDNDGNALIPGAIYFNTTLSVWKGWSGAAWHTGLVTNIVHDQFSGNGATTAFTLSADPGSDNALRVEVDSVPQYSWTRVGTTLTFSAAPGVGTNNIQIWIYGIAQNIGVPSDATVGRAALTDALAASVFINPAEFGAIGNGVADDTAALLACLQDGRPVALEPGAIYKITAALDLRAYSGRVIFGPSSAAQPSGAFGGAQPAIIRQATANTQILRIGGSHNIISGFYLDYATQAPVTDTASIALELHNVSHSTFRGLRIFKGYQSVGIPQSAVSPTAYNALFDCMFDGIDSNNASGVHIDLRNYNAGGTNATLRNIYLNGGGSLDFVTPGQSCTYAMRFANWGGLNITGPSIDGMPISTSAIEFNNCIYSADQFRFEAVNITADAAIWIDHEGGYNDGDVPVIEFRTCKWTPSAASSMYLLKTASTVVKLSVGKVLVVSDCAFNGGVGTRRVLNNSGPVETGTGYVNDISVGNIEDQGSKLSDLIWTDGIASPGPGLVSIWNAAAVMLRLRPWRSSTTIRIVAASAIPTAGTWALGDIVVNNSAVSGRVFGWQCTVAGTPGTWTPIALLGTGGLQQRGDVAVTLTPGTDSEYQRFITTLTADRAVTLSTTGVWPGAKFEIARPATGAFNVNVGTGPLKALAAGTWCEVVYDGGAAAWVLGKYGAL